MDLDERTKRLKMFLELESDKGMIGKLKIWHSEMNVIFQETGDVGMDDSKRLILEHFPTVIEDAELRKRLTSVIKMLQTFEDAAVTMDGVSIESASNVVQEVLDSIE